MTDARGIRVFYVILRCARLAVIDVVLLDCVYDLVGLYDLISYVFDFRVGKPRTYCFKIGVADVINHVVVEERARRRLFVTAFVGSHITTRAYRQAHFISSVDDIGHKSTVTEFKTELAFARVERRDVILRYARFGVSPGMSRIIVHGSDRESEVINRLGVYAVDFYRKNVVLAVKFLAVERGRFLTRGYSRNGRHNLFALGKIFGFRFLREQIGNRRRGRPVVNYVVEVIALGSGEIVLPFFIPGEIVFVYAVYAVLLYRVFLAQFGMFVDIRLNFVLIASIRFFFVQLIISVGVFHGISGFFGVFLKEIAVSAVVIKEYLPDFGEIPVLIRFLVYTVPVRRKFFLELFRNRFEILFGGSLLLVAPVAYVIGSFVVGSLRVIVADKVHKIADTLICFADELFLESRFVAYLFALLTIAFKSDYIGRINSGGTGVRGIEINVKVEKNVLYRKRLAVRELYSVFDEKFVSRVSAFGFGRVILGNRRFVFTADDFALRIGAEHSDLSKSRYRRIVCRRREIRVENAVRRRNTHRERACFGIVRLRLVSRAGDNDSHRSADGDNARENDCDQFL